MCDAYFGRLLDYFDAHEMWKDTALILTTDHGFLLSEHELWAKNVTPCYDELARIPLIVHHPDWVERPARRSDLVTQTPDLMPTLLGLFGRAGRPRCVLRRSSPASTAGEDGRVVIFGMFGGAVNAADARYRLHALPARPR